MKVLILASNPRKDLDLDREIRDLKQVIEKSQNREQFEVIDELAVRVRDLQDLLFRYRPQIVHFCGHGAGEQGLVFEGEEGEEQWVQTQAISDLFRLFSNSVKCVLLNACYSESQANAIVEHINYVIGMQQEIRDDAAIAFSKGFYRALGYSASLEEAYEFGCNAIQLEIVGNSVVKRSALPESMRKAEVVDAIANTVIPENLKPVFRCKRGIFRNPERNWSNGTLSEDSKEELLRELVQVLAGFNARPVAPPVSEVRLTAPEPPALSQTAPSQTVPSQTLQSQTGRSQTVQQPANPKRLRRILLGCLAALVIPGIGIYGYQQWRSSQPEQVTLRQAIELAKQEKWDEAIERLEQIPIGSSVGFQMQSYLEEWSRQLLKRAQDSYEEGNIDEAVRVAQAIPQNSVIYSQVQEEIAAWQEDQQRLEKIRTDLETAYDIKGAGEQLKSIRSAGLRTQAEILIQRYSAIVNGDVYGKMQQEMALRDEDQKKLEQIRTILRTAYDLKGANQLLTQIQSSAVRQEARDLIRQYTAIVSGNSRSSSSRRSTSNTTTTPSVAPVPQQPDDSNQSKPPDLPEGTVTNPPVVVEDPQEPDPPVVPTPVIPDPTLPEKLEPPPVNPDPPVAPSSEGNANSGNPPSATQPTDPATPPAPAASPQ